MGMNAHVIELKMEPCCHMVLRFNLNPVNAYRFFEKLPRLVEHILFISIDKESEMLDAVDNKRYPTFFLYAVHFKPNTSQELIDDAKHHINNGN